MKDRFSRTMLAIIALSLATLAVKSVATLMPGAHAQLNPTQRCYWTWVGDDGNPDLGKDGKIELKGKDWQQASSGGWELKAVHENHYIFEKCEPL